MVLDVTVDKASVSVPIDTPFDADLDSIHAQIERLALSRGIDIGALDVRGLILKMIRGIAGCEHGCPANAKDLESTGHRGFRIRYVDGGILTADIMTANGANFLLRMFPDF